MGLLDEAIREHLELKRKHGAREGELEELEHEAFGPSLQTGELPASPQAEAMSEIVDLEAGEEPSEIPAAVPQPPTQEFTVPAPPPPPPPGTEEHALPFEQAAPEAGQPPPPEDYEPPTEPTIEEPLDKIGESLSVITEGGSPSADFYDFEEPAEEALEPEAAFAEPKGQYPEEPAFSEPLPEGQAFAEPAPEAPIEPLEAPSEGELAYELAEEEPAEEAEVEDYEEEEEDEGGTVEESGLFDQEGDVLEETPEFLQDSPDDDELWFEQRPPKDFDL
jgi:hypothetical protein